METRTTTEVKLYFLILNDMRSPKVEIGKVAAFSTAANPLEAFIEEERVPTWRDEEGTKWRKSFKKDGPLEWFNLPMYGFEQGIFYYWHSMETFEGLKKMHLFLPENEDLNLKEKNHE